MQGFSLPTFSEKGTRFTMFLFSGLFIFSVAFFVFAESSSSTKNVFQDSDQDGLSNDEEKLYGTDETKKDTDGDGYSDGVEIESGYDPLKPAPGDKIIKESSTIVPSEPYAAADGETNLTEQVSSEIALMVKNTGESGKDISIEDINSAVDKVMSGSAEEVVLPEVKLEDIKIKKVSKSLSSKKRAEQEKEDSLEYLTVVSYLVANNSPKSFQTENQLFDLFSTMSTGSITALASGNTQPLDELSKQGGKMLDELKDIEVPEKMLDVHIKALQMAMYALRLKDEVKPADVDPLGQIAVLSRAQGFFGSVSGLVTEIEKKLSDYGIQEIPLNL